MKKIVRRKQTPVVNVAVTNGAYLELGEMFRRGRTEAGIDIEALASIASVSTVTIRRLEKAPEKVPLHDLYAVANALNLDPGLVIGFLHSAIS